jgi:hypothetical protein
MEAVRTFEMSVNRYHATRRNNPEDSHLNTTSRNKCFSSAYMNEAICTVAIHI